MKDTTKVYGAAIGIILWVALMAGFWGGLAYLAIHFIRKLW